MPTAVGLFGRLDEVEGLVEVPIDLRPRPERALARLEAATGPMDPRVARAAAARAQDDDRFSCEWR